jgi:hypothetical protein
MCKCSNKEDEIVYGVDFSNGFEIFNSIVKLDKKESQNDNCHCHNAS